MAYDNAKLVELFEKIQRKNHLEAVLKELRENIALLEPEVRKLMTQMYLEQEDVDKIEGNGFKSFFYSLTGRKHDIIDKERQEAYDAKKKYDAANFQLETMKNDLKRYIDEYNEVRYLEPEYEKAIKEKIELIKAKGGIETEKIAEFDKQIDVLRVKGNELREARIETGRAEGIATQLINILTDAEKLAKKDLMGFDWDYKNGENLDRRKHNMLKEAEYLSDQFAVQMGKMNKELRDVNLYANIDLKIGTLAKAADRFIDDIFTNASVADKITDAKERARDARIQLSQVERSLAEQISQIESQQNELKKQRDEIVRNAEV